MSNKQNDILFDIQEEGTVHFNCEKCNKSGSSQDTSGWKKISDLRRVSGYYMLCPDCENPITIGNIGISLEEISTTGNCKKSIIHADEIVSYLKKTTRVLENYSMINEVDFFGCSYNYCIEKINRLENTLKYLKKNLKLLDK